MTEPSRKQLLPGIFDCALLILEDGCPPEKDMNLCRHEDGELYGPEEACTRCWKAYLYYVSNGRKEHPYRKKTA